MMRTSELMAFVLARDPGFQVSEVLEVTRGVTCEGEHAVWLRLAGRRDGIDCARAIGAVLTDHFTAILDALALDRERASALETNARKLLFDAAFSLGVRPRRYEYAPPTGWIGLPIGLDAAWYPPDFPANRAVLSVAPALPANDDSTAVLDEYVADQAARGLHLDVGPVEQQVVAQGGLMGRRWTLRLSSADLSEPLHRELTVLYAAPYIYALRLDADAVRAAEHAALFGAVVASVKPVPTAPPLATTGASRSAFGHLFEG